MDIPVLDHGYVNLVETWGSDERIIESARQSTSGSFRGWTHSCRMCMGDGTPCLTCGGKGEIEGDTKLLKYLYTHKHMTPFEMCGLTVEVQAPIMVFREWHR